VAHRPHLSRGTLSLSDAAACACLDRARRDATDLDLLINAGIYKHRNVAEPALASIIQEDIGANPGHPPRPNHHGTFSFDVLDGACGCLTAAYFIDGFLRDRRADVGMVVAGDGDPGASRGFPFADVAGALLLAYTDGGEGFERFAFRAFPQHIGLFESELHWRPEERTLLGRDGRNVLEVHEDPRFGACCVECAAEVAATFLSDVNVRPTDVDLLVASQYPSRFASDLARKVGVEERRIAHAAPACSRAHTAGPLAALEAARASGQFDVAHTILFVTAGAGISVATALYRR